MIAKQAEIRDFSYREKVTPSLAYTVGVDKILAEGKSDFQDILLIQSKCFGRTLVLDNQVRKYPWRLCTC